jgi:hypothetical protein
LAGAVQTLECVTKLDASIRNGTRGSPVDPHQERVEILGFNESVGALATYTLFLRRYGSYDGLLEAILFPVAQAGGEVA